MPATLQQNSALESDLVRSRVVVSETAGGLDLEPPVSEEAISASIGGPCAVAFSADGLTGLAILDGLTWARSTTDGVWVTSLVEDLFGAPDGQRATGIAWGAGNVCVMVGYYDDGTPHTWALYSSDGGATWTETASDLSAYDGAGYNPGVASDGASGFVMLNADPGSTYQFLAARSADGGATWTIANGPTAGAIAGAASPVYDATSGRFIVATPSGSSYSTDSGATWSSPASFPGTGVTSVAGIARLGVYLYATGVNDATGTPVAAVWRSGNDASSWSLLSTSGLSGLYALVSVCPIGDSMVATGVRLASGDVLFVSVDGTAWTSLSDAIGLAPGQTVSATVGRGRFYAAATNLGFGGSDEARILSAEYEVLPSESTYGDGNIQLDDGLTSAVILSLFTDRRANADDAPSPDDLRGYWAAPYIGEDWGSLLWTLQGAPATPENFRKAEDFAKQAFAWMVEDGIAKEIRATASYADDGWCRMLIEIRSGTGPMTKWRTLWEGTINGL